MTVTYSRRVADAGLGTFFHLLLRWKGSIYKLLYRELIIFTVLYYFFSIVYRYSYRKPSGVLHMKYWESNFMYFLNLSAFVRTKEMLFSPGVC